MLLVLACFFLIGALAVFAEVATLAGRQREAALRRAKAYGAGTATIADVPLRGRALTGARDALARLGARLSPSSTAEALSLKLIAAGLAGRLTPAGYLASKVIGGSVGVVLGALLGALTDSPLRTLFLVGIFAAVGFFVPDFVLSQRTRERRDDIRAELPDALDVLAVSVEAGLGFDGAIAKLSEYLRGPLVQEFQLTLSEMRIGESRQEALRRMAERVDVPELSSVVQAIIQADELGSPLARVLRVQAKEARHRRRAAAEERAMRMPVKMIFPTAFFIFPAMFIVILGPAVLNIKAVF